MATRLQKISTHLSGSALRPACAAAPITSTVKFPVRPLSPLVLRSGGVCISRPLCGQVEVGDTWVDSIGEIVDGHGGGHHVDTIFDAVFRPHADGSAGIRVTAVEDEKLTAEMTVRRHPSVASTPLPSQSHPVILWCRWKRAT